MTSELIERSSYAQASAIEDCYNINLEVHVGYPAVCRCSAAAAPQPGRRESAPRPQQQSGRRPPTRRRAPASRAATSWLQGGSSADERLARCRSPREPEIFLE